MYIITYVGKDFSNWIIYVTVKQYSDYLNRLTDFSNWIIYVTVKLLDYVDGEEHDFSNWIIYVTVKHFLQPFLRLFILVTE